MSHSLDLRKTLDCGQAFRWSEENGLWTGTASGRTLKVSENDKGKIACDPFWADYFDLNFDYEAADREIRKVSPVAAEAVDFSTGIHILNQDSWEALCSFVISQNNNIKRIKLIISRLCGACGTQSFPTPRQIVDLGTQGLRELGLGFRDAYVFETASKVVSGEIDLAAVKTLPDEQAFAVLKSVRGIGDKVASCALLYGFHRFDCFPMDVWMKRVMNDCFDGKDGRKLFGPLAGLAQQYLFFWAREKFYR